jgi:hypothetical protein
VHARDIAPTVDNADEHWTGTKCCIAGPSMCVTGTFAECDNADEHWTGTECSVTNVDLCVTGTLDECDNADEHWTGTHCCVGPPPPPYSAADGTPSLPGCTASMCDTSRMRASVGFGIVCVALIASTATAHAAWYYTYSCSGACAPEQLAAVGVSPGFMTASECESARNADSRRYTNQQSGSLGGLSLCFESDTQPSPDAGGASGPRNPPPFQAFAAGVIGGPGYKPVNENDGRVAAGLDLAFMFGGKPFFALVLRTGFRGSHFDSDATTLTHLGMFWPLMVGITFAPGSYRTRFEFGADGGFEVSAACKGCPGGALVGVLRGGLVHYFASPVDFSKRGDRSGRMGLSLEVVKEYRSGTIDSSMALFRLSFRMRNDVLSW